MKTSNKYKVPIIVITIILALTLFAVAVKTVVYRGYKNQWLLTKEVTSFSYWDSGMSGSWNFDIKVDGDIITATYTDIFYPKGTEKTIESVWSKEKFTSYLTELTRYDVLSWKKEYGKGYEDRVSDGGYWGLNITFSDGTDFSSNGYYKKPTTYDRFINTTLKFFSEEN